MWSFGDRVFESTLGEGDRVSLGQTTLEEEIGEVWEIQTLEARGRGPPSPFGGPGLQGLPPQTPLPPSSRVASPNSPPPLTKGCLRPLLL